ncbi:cyclic di-GMP binding protein [Spirochaetia bacterium]|nr:cyclic di-GMP binding protein [Spirochaetia bacterium]
MALITSQKISSFYERFKAIDVTFSKEIIQVTGLITQQVYLKCGGDFWPCVIYSSSFQGAKVAANTQSGLAQKLQTVNNAVALRFCFKKTVKDAPVTFAVAARVSGFAPYGNSNEVALFSLQFNQRPPDALIEIIGRVLDANVASAKRREERVLLTTDIIRKMSLSGKETAVFIQGVPRRCILRDISFSGAKLIMMGVAKFLVDREAALRIDFDDPRESFLIKGSFLRSEEVEGRKELVALAVLFTDATIPMGYKVRLNEYLSRIKVDKPAAAAETEKPEKPAADGAAPASTDTPPAEPAAAEAEKSAADGTAPTSTDTPPAEPAKSAASGGEGPAKT